MFLSNGPNDNYELGSHVPLNALSGFDQFLELGVWDVRRQACATFVSYNRL